METWVWATLAAAGVQTLRFALQKTLKGAGLSTGGATFSRFLFAAPLAAALAAILVLREGLPGIAAGFWPFVVAGGLAQILATLATVALFSARNFAVGVAFTKTEVLLVAGFSAVVLGEVVGPAALGAMLVGLAGVVLLSWSPGRGALALLNRASGLGIAAGALFGLSAIGYRGATQALDGGGTLLRAAFTLAAVTLFQSVSMAIWLRLRQPGELGRVLARWRMTALVGVTGMLGSLGWFVAFTLQNAAFVRAVGQVELVFSILVGWLVFRERGSLREALGIGLLLASIVALILLG